MQRTKPVRVLTVLSHQLRRMVGKASNRAAVHGSKLPIPDTVPKDEVEMDINRAVHEKETKRREIEHLVDSNLHNWKVLRLEDVVSSK